MSPEKENNGRLARFYSGDIYTQDEYVKAIPIWGDRKLTYRVKYGEQMLIIYQHSGEGPWASIPMFFVPDSVYPQERIDIVDFNSGADFLAEIYKIAGENGGGAAIELIADGETDKTFERQFWDNWLQELGNTSQHERKVYATQIYPVIVDAVVDIANQTQGQVEVVDLFSGEGSLVEQILTRQEIEPKIASITLAEGSAVGVSIAREKFNSDNRVRVLDQVDLTSIENILPLQKESLQRIITISGGLNKGVVSKQQALGVATKLADALEVEDHLVVTGYSYCLLDSDDWRRLGFAVHNTGVIANFGTPRRPKQLYVVSKSP